MEMNGTPQECHEMKFERVVALDVDELYCPLCGRRIQVQWSPDFKKIVMDVGDENVVHTATKSGLFSPDREAVARDYSQTAVAVDPHLLEWEVMLDTMNFESLWR